jgi:hypothetical protein
LVISAFQVLDWRATEYMVTDQRVFFDTWIGYAVVNLADVERIYVKIGLLDRIFRTGNVCVTYEGFDTPTRFWSGRWLYGDLVVKHGVPCFRSIKDFVEVERIIQNASAGKK